MSTKNDIDVKSLVKNMTSQPGVYQMINAAGEVIYVGKARNLKNRLQSYFRQSNLPAKSQVMVAQIADIQITITHSDAEALLLEHTLIKKHLPRYNVLLRDDKSYPYILLTTQQQYPRISLYRGARKNQGKFYGPYPSAHAARETMNFLQRVFKVRPCRDAYFNNRSRPCLQYQIKRCTAPCVKYVSEQDYREQVRHVQLFLEGKGQAIIDDLIVKMQQASTDLDFEKAANLRDTIASLNQIHAQQAIVRGDKNADVIYLLERHGVILIQVLFIRHGEVIGSKCFFPSSPAKTSSEEAINAFLSQFYLQRLADEQWPHEVVVSIDFPERNELAASLSELAQKKLQILATPRTAKKRWLEMAKQNAEFEFDKYLSDKGENQKRLALLAESLQLSQIPERIECFDVSHSFGEATVASCVVFDKQGMFKQDYRHYNIKDVAKGDDYAALKQALLRRYQKLVTQEAKLPDIVLIDGGKGQLKQAVEVFQSLNITGVTLMAISKGTTRKPGFETLHLAYQDIECVLAPDSPALHLLQQIRDEAHRFAITGHRAQRGKKRTTSVLEEIPGIGAARRRALIQRFGGIQAIKNASIEEIAKTPGISLAVAKLIFDAFHE